MSAKVILSDDGARWHSSKSTCQTVHISPFCLYISVFLVTSLENPGSSLMPLLCFTLIHWFYFKMSLDLFFVFKSTAVVQSFFCWIFVIASKVAFLFPLSSPVSSPWSIVNFLKQSVSPSENSTDLISDGRSPNSSLLRHLRCLSKLQLDLAEISSKKQNKGS